MKKEDQKILDRLLRATGRRPDGQLVLKCRLFTEKELLQDPEFKSVWETNDSRVLDRSLMKRCSLERWVRQLMPCEIARALELEPDKGYNCCLVEVLIRGPGVRVKKMLRLELLDPDAKETELKLDAAQMAELATAFGQELRVVFANALPVPDRN